MRHSSWKMWKKTPSCKTNLLIITLAHWKLENKIGDKHDCTSSLTKTKINIKCLQKSKRKDLYYF